MTISACKPTTRLKRALGLLLATSALSVGLVSVTPQPAQAYPGNCIGHPYYRDDKPPEDEGKLRRIFLYCDAGPGRPDLFLGTITVIVEWSHRVQVEVCDGHGDGVSPRASFRWRDGALYAYSDYNGSGAECLTHRIGVDDTPAKFQTVTLDDDNLFRWNVKFGSYATDPFVWPLHSF